MEPASQASFGDLTTAGKSEDDHVLAVCVRVEVSRQHPARFPPIPEAVQFVGSHRFTSYLCGRAYDVP